VKTLEDYQFIDDYLELIVKRIDSFIPAEAHPQAVADEVARIITLAKGKRPARSIIDFVNDGAAEVTELVEKCGLILPTGLAMKSCFHQQDVNSS
jgi:hypothetical protein